eukprot:SAG31_NODE_1039_length_10212_cov_8.897063_4_plen_580_part_00
MVRLSLLLLPSAVALQLLCGPCAATATTHVHSQSHCPTAAAIARSAQQLCGSSLMDSLRLVGLTATHSITNDDEAELATPPPSLLQLLQNHGFRTALDLRLMDSGGAEVTELMDELRAGGISIGDRSKVRLLLGDEEYRDHIVPRTNANPRAASAASSAPRERINSCTRQLQVGNTGASDAGSSDGMSIDTIAIVLSVLVGAAGYMVQVSRMTDQHQTNAARALSFAGDTDSTCNCIRCQTYTARQTEKSLAKQAQEQRAHEVSQQRDHERLVAQIARTIRAVDGCCAPVIRGLGCYASARIKFVTALANKLEADQPEAFAEVYASSGYAMKDLVTTRDGAVHGPDGELLLDSSSPGQPQRGQTRAAPTNMRAFFMGSSAKTVDVAFSDFKTAWAVKPYTRELPEAFFELMSTDLNGPFASDYRGYIKYEIKPVLDLIADIVQAHFATIEQPPVEWLLENFPGHTKTDSSNNIPDGIVAYSRSWARVLARWDAEQLDLLYPPSYMMPWRAANTFFGYSRQRGEAKRECLYFAALHSLSLLALCASLTMQPHPAEEELIGMSSGKKDATAKHMDALIGVK